MNENHTITLQDKKWGMPVRVIKFVMIPSVEAIRSAGKESV